MRGCITGLGPELGSPDGVLYPVPLPCATTGPALTSRTRSVASVCAPSRRDGQRRAGSQVGGLSRHTVDFLMFERGHLRFPFAPSPENLCKYSWVGRRQMSRKQINQRGSEINADSGTLGGGNSRGPQAGKQGLGRGWGLAWVEGTRGVRCSRRSLGGGSPRTERPRWRARMGSVNPGWRPG